MEPKLKRKAIIVRMDASLHERLVTQAQIEQDKVNHIVVTLVKKWLKTVEKAEASK